MLVGCGGAVAPSGGTPDASPDQDQAACCPPDPSPGCCMHYGGWSGDGNACGAVCDGMPEPGDPAWHLVKDSHGCDVWSSSGSNGPTCGGPPANDPGCPSTFQMSLCGTPCTQPGLQCSYPNGGDAMFCNAYDGGATWGCGV